MNRLPESERDPIRIAVPVFAVMFAYCLLVAHLLTDATWRAGMLGAAVAYAFAVLFLVVLRRRGSGDG